MVNTTHRSPARAAYAAAAAPALPDEAAVTVSAPAASAAATPTAIARSLCEPVGLAPSFFSQRPSTSGRTNVGVLPSPSVTGRVTGADRAAGQPHGPPGQSARDSPDRSASGGTGLAPMPSARHAGHPEKSSAAAPQRGQFRTVGST